MDKKAQGLPITTIIIAILGLVVLVILFAITTGRLAIFGRATAECPGVCVEPYTGDTPNPNARECTAGFEREVGGNYVQSGQPTNIKPADIKRCTRCCVPIA
jgi:hypothetical protein